MSIRTSIINAMAGQPPLAGRVVAQLAALDYKVTIDALDRMNDAGTVTRHGSKRGARWSLLAIPAAAAVGIAALEGQWHGRTTPTPRGEAQGTTPASMH